MSQLDPTSQRHLMTIWNSAERAGRLVDELLNFSRLGRLEIKRDLVPLRDVVVDARAQVESEAERKFKVDWRIEELSDVVGDRSMLLLVFVNLLSNAIKYSMNSASPTIRIYQPSSPTEVIVAVADNGIGFDMAYVDKLFGIFQRLHVPGEFDGIGIGLANVKTIVTKHGGRVWAEGKPGEGATFYVALPKN